MDEYDAHTGHFRRDTIYLGAGWTLPFSYEGGKREALIASEIRTTRLPCSGSPCG